MRILLLGSLLFLLSMGCRDSRPEFADLVLLNGNILTMDTANARAEALAIVDDRIIFVGSNDEVAKLQDDDTRVIDLQGRFVMPGLIEGHGHFWSLAELLLNINLLQTTSWQEVIEAVEAAVAEAEPGQWVEGRGWHQEKWTDTPEPNLDGYPFHHSLSAVSPDNPVVLRHASGHALFANEAAMKAAGISPETADPKGGHILRDSDGQAIGVFEETAMVYLNEALEKYKASLSDKEEMQQWRNGIDLASQECLRKGITSFQDAGSTFEQIDRYQRMAKKGQLDLRLWAMVRFTSDPAKGHSYDELVKGTRGYPIMGAGNGFFTARAIKADVDGALGSFGAWLLEPYADKPDFVGQNTTELEDVEKVAELAADRDLQLCVHAIGDRGNRETLDLYERVFREHPEQTDLRWRIEHAQHLDPADIPRFHELGVIAAMQGIHCTSDAPFVVKRLGEERARAGAYAWRSLLDQGAVVSNGTDTPVEDVDPFACLYASVTRRRPDSGLVFFPEQCMTRQEALYSYTMANAYAAFEEMDKGSLEAGKYADLVVLSNDLLTCSDEAILQTKVLLTMVAGKVRYSQGVWDLPEE